MYILKSIPEKQLLWDAYISRLRCTLFFFFFFKGISGTVCNLLGRIISCHCL